MLLGWALSLSCVFMTVEMIFRVNKIVSRFLAITPLFFLFILIAFNRMSRDYPAYELAFIDETFRNTLEFGYVFLINTVNRFGGDQSTITIISGAFLVVVLLRLLKTSGYVNWVIFFYCGFPLVYDITQTRNFLMYLIATLSLVYVMENKPIKHYLLLFLASSMHTLAWMYAPFYYFCKKSRKQYVSFIVITTAILFVASPIAMMILAHLFPLTGYLKRTPGKMMFFYIALVLIDIFTVWWIDKKISGKISEQDSRKMEVLYRFVWWPMLITPFLHYFLEIIRLERNALLAKYVFCALAMKYLNLKQRVIVTVLLIVSISIEIGVLAYTDQWDLIEYLDENSVKHFIEWYFF